MIELELTYLAKYLPRDLDRTKFKEIVDIYVPNGSDHLTLRIRKSGDKYEITKKEPLKGKDSSIQLEQTISLKEAEYMALSKIKGKTIKKKRYFYTFKDQPVEIDVFQGDLKGLVLIDFEFKTRKEKDNFKKPDFCLEEITQEKFIAGGVLCSKSYNDLKKELNRWGYKKIVMK